MGIVLYGPIVVKYLKGERERDRGVGKRSSELLFYEVIKEEVCEIRLPQLFSHPLPGTVSGNVSFCIVCIAFSAFRARYHLE